MHKTGGLLKRTLLSDLIFDKKELIQVEVKDSLEHVLNVLKTNEILSVPVYDAKKCQYVGVVDTFDIMTMISLGAFIKEEGEIDPQLFRSKTVMDLIDTVARTKNITVFEPYDSIENILEPMGARGLRRVLVRQKDDYSNKSTFRTLTQTDVIRYMLKHADECAIFDRRVDEWGLGFEIGKRPTLIEGHVNSTALELYQKMWTEGISAIPIVDDKRRCVTTLSPSDLRGLDIDNIKSILLPVMDFLKSMNSGKKPVQPVTCGPKDQMKEVLLRAVAAKVHRVWVVDEAVRPVGVVAFTDILAKCIDERR